jgi:hypothetical protein
MEAGTCLEVVHASAPAKELSHYEELPSELGQNVIDSAEKVRSNHKRHYETRDSPCRPNRVVEHSSRIIVENWALAIAEPAGSMLHICSCARRGAEQPGRMAKI